MRLVAQGVTEAYQSEKLVSGGRKVAWRAFPCKLRVKNNAAGTCTVTITNGETGEEVTPALNVTANGGISSPDYERPSTFRVEVGTVVAPIDLTIWIDGDTGNDSAGIPGSGFNQGFSVGFGG